MLLFKVLILQSLYNLADSAVEFQILDRHSFSRFLGLHTASKVPDATTIWLFREDLIRAQVVEELFGRFDQFPSEAGFWAQKGQIIDASIVRVPVQRNSREENRQIKAAEQPEGWSETKNRGCAPMGTGSGCSAKTPATIRFPPGSSRETGRGLAFASGLNMSSASGPRERGTCSCEESAWPGRWPGLVCVT